MPVLLTALALVSLSALTGCQRTPLATPAPVVGPTPTRAPDDVAPSTIATSRGLPLRVWLPPDIATASVRDTGRAVLFISLAAERAELDGQATLEITTIALHGPGGLRESLLATAPVAPARLPHLALIDTADLTALVAGGLVRPLDSPPAHHDDLWALTQEAVTVNDVVYGVPLCVDLELLAYDTQVITAPPRTWADLLTDDEPLLFPAKSGADAADLLLAHYLSEGGVVSAVDPVLDTGALSRALAAYQVGRAAERIHGDATTTESLDASWAAYLAGRANLVATTSRQVLRDGEGIRATALAALPQSGTQPLVLGRVLAWVVISSDPEAQRLALAMAEASLAVDLQRALTLQSYYMPAVSPALDAASAGPWFVQLAGLAAVARPIPNVAPYDAVENALGEAAASVASGASSPAAAASMAAARVNQSQ